MARRIRLVKKGAILAGALVYVWFAGVLCAGAVKARKAARRAAEA